MEFIEVQERPFSLLYPSFLQFIPFMRNWKQMRDIMGVHLGLQPGDLIRNYKLYEQHEEGWLERQYTLHNEAVQKHVPKDQLLVFNVKEGWKPLCRFLGEEIPADPDEGIVTPFPYVNESQELKRATMLMKVVSYGWIPVLVGLFYYAAVSVRLALGGAGGGGQQCRKKSKVA